MSKNNTSLAEALYTAFGEKKLADMEQYLLTDVHFFDPLAQMTGKQTYLDSAKNFLFK